MYFPSPGLSRTGKKASMVILKEREKKLLLLAFTFQLELRFVDPRRLSYERLDAETRSD